MSVTNRRTTATGIALPDAGATSARGRQGQVEFNRVTGPGFCGWPYCTGANTSAETYAEWNFATNAAGPKYNCSGGPTDNSFRNTGLSTLPAAKPAWIRYGGDAGTPSPFGRGWIKPIHLNADGSPGTIDSFPRTGKQVINAGGRTPGTGPIVGIAGKGLDVRGGSAADGTQVQISSGNSSSDGAVVHLWTCHGGANQKWTLP